MLQVSEQLVLVVDQVFEVPEQQRQHRLALDRLAAEEQAAIGLGRDLDLFVLFSSTSAFVAV